MAEKRENKDEIERAKEAEKWKIVWNIQMKACYTAAIQTFDVFATFWPAILQLVRTPESFTQCGTWPDYRPKLAKKMPTKSRDFISAPRILKQGLPFYFATPERVKIYSRIHPRELCSLTSTVFLPAQNVIFFAANKFTRLHEVEHDSKFAKVMGNRDRDYE